MQAQVYEGYYENGQFYPTGHPVKIKQRHRALLTLLPMKNNAEPSVHHDDESAQDWLDDFFRLLGTATAELNEEDFPRMDLGRELIAFESEA